MDIWLILTIAGMLLGLAGGIIIQFLVPKKD